MAGLILCSFSLFTSINIYASRLLSGKVLSEGTPKKNIFLCWLLNNNRFFREKLNQTLTSSRPERQGFTAWGINRADNSPGHSYSQKPLVTADENNRFRL